MAQQVAMMSRSLARPDAAALRSSRATVRPRVARPAVVCAARDERVAGTLPLPPSLMLPCLP